jgi:hypothetical protein
MEHAPASEIRPLRQIGPWRAAINWYFSILFFGALVATVVTTLPLFATLFLLYGFKPPDPSYETLRSLQIVQSVVVSIGGGYFARRYFARTYAITYSHFAFQLKALAAGVPLTCIAVVLGISIPKYGVSLGLILTAR